MTPEQLRHYFWNQVAAMRAEGANEDTIMLFLIEAIVETHRVFILFQSEYSQLSEQVITDVVNNNLATFRRYQ